MFLLDIIMQMTIELKPEADIRISIIFNELTCPHSRILCSHTGVLIANLRMNKYKHKNTASRVNKTNHPHSIHTIVRARTTARVREKHIHQERISQDSCWDLLHCTLGMLLRLECAPNVLFASAEFNSTSSAPHANTICQRHAICYMCRFPPTSAAELANDWRRPKRHRYSTVSEHRADAQRVRCPLRFSYDTFV